MNTFWHTLPKPFSVLAPMDGVTDVIFRQILTEIGKPDVLFTEFTMCHGLLSAGRKRVEENLFYTPEQQPLVAQIWGTDPEHFYLVAKELKQRGFAGIDINMGCPDRTVVKYGSGSALITNPALAKKIIHATKEGAGDVPVSVKTRLGFDTDITKEWIGFLLEQDLAALSVHVRTAKELSNVPARWEAFRLIKKLQQQIAPNTILIGNGDITSLSQAQEMYKTYEVDGVMIGRGVFANPWIFNKQVDPETVSVSERISLYLHHIELFEKQWGNTKNFAFLKKFAKTYIQNYPNAAHEREKVMETKNIEELKEVLRNYI